MRNPFKAIGSAIANAGKATGRAIAGAGKTVASAPGAVVRAVKAPFSKKEKAPPRPATTRPPAAPRGETRVMPTVKPPAPPPSPPAGKKLPPSMVPGRGPGRGPAGGMTRDDAILGADSDSVRDLIDAVIDFEGDNGLLGLNKEALDFLARPSYSAILDQYVPGGGFSSEQFEAGMKEIRNIRINRIGNKIKIKFDAYIDIDGSESGELGWRSPNATFG